MSTYSGHEGHDVSGCYTPWVSVNFVTDRGTHRVLGYRSRMNKEYETDRTGRGLGGVCDGVPTKLVRNWWICFQTNRTVSGGPCCFECVSSFVLKEMCPITDSLCSLLVELFGMDVFRLFIFLYGYSGYLSLLSRLFQNRNTHRFTFFSNEIHFFLQLPPHNFLLFQSSWC